MMKSFRILFTGVGRRVELMQAFRQAANHLNVNLKLYGADMTGTAPALAFCDVTRKSVECVIKNIFLSYWKSVKWIRLI